MLGNVDDAPPVTSRPYRARWSLAEARHYFACPPTPLALSLLEERMDRGLIWREVSFTADVDTAGIATVVLPASRTLRRGVVLAHGGSHDGRRFFRSEAAALAAQGAVVILPATRMRTTDGVEAFVADVRVAVLTERASLSDTIPENPL